MDIDEFDNFDDDIDIVITKSSTDDVAYSYLNKRVTELETKSEESDNDIAALVEFTDIDIDDINKKHLIFHEDKTVTWDYLPLINNSSVSTTVANVGDEFEVYGSATGGKQPYTYSYYYKRSSVESWTNEEINTSSTSVTMNPTVADTFNIKVTVKDSDEKTADKVFQVIINPKGG